MRRACRCGLTAVVSSRSGSWCRLCFPGRCSRDRSCRCRSPAGRVATAVIAAGASAVRVRRRGGRASRRRRHEGRRRGGVRDPRRRRTRTRGAATGQRVRHRMHRRCLRLPAVRSRVVRGLLADDRLLHGAARRDCRGDDRCRLRQHGRRCRLRRQRGDDPAAARGEPRDDGRQSLGHGGPRGRIGRPQRTPDAAADGAAQQMDLRGAIEGAGLQRSSRPGAADRRLEPAHGDDEAPARARREPVDLACGHAQGESRLARLEAEPLAQHECLALGHREAGERLPRRAHLVAQLGRSLDAAHRRRFEAIVERAHSGPPRRLAQPAHAFVACDPQHPGARFEYRRSAGQRPVHGEERRLGRVLGVLAPPEQVPRIAEHRVAVPLVEQLGGADRVTR